MIRGRPGFAGPLRQQTAGGVLVHVKIVSKMGQRMSGAWHTRNRDGLARGARPGGFEALLRFSGRTFG
jgi:hypothetical protein